MRKAGVTDYEEFASSVIRSVPRLPVSFEVLSDDLDEMARQAQKDIQGGGKHYVKIPITNKKRASTVESIKDLSHNGVKVNVTAILMPEQVELVFLMRPRAYPRVCRPHALGNLFRCPR